MDLDVSAEANRLYGLVCEVLDVPTLPSGTSSPRRSKSIGTAQTPVSATPSTLLAVLTVHLPQARSNLDSILKTHRRPSPLTRFWFPLLFLPPAVLILSRTLLRNKEWMQEQIRNSRETIRDSSCSGYGSLWKGSERHFDKAARDSASRRRQSRRTSR